MAGFLIDKTYVLNSRIHDNCLYLLHSGDLRNDMYQRHMEELERKTKEHEAHMQAARMELERAVEISKQKVCIKVFNIL